MKAHWYTFSRLRHPQSGLTIVWVPEAQLQFQWAQPNGAVQIVPASRPIPPDALGVLVPDGVRYLRYPLVKAALRYLKRQEHLQAQRAVLQSAMDRITEGETRNEFHLQEAAGKLLRDKPAEKPYTSKGVKVVVPEQARESVNS